MMKKTLIGSALVFCAAGAVGAETFTVTSNTRTTNSINIDTGATTTAGAAFNEFDSQGVYASGQKTTSKGECAAWSTVPGSQMTTEGVCTYTEGASDKASIEFGCVDDIKASTGKTGTISWRQTLSSDGKTSKAVGVGMWND
jgi:hypothetical protein